MGRAMLLKWLQDGLNPQQISIVKPSAFAPNDPLSCIDYASDLSTLFTKQPNVLEEKQPIIFLGVKPYQFKAIYPDLKRTIISQDAIYLSVAAGISLDSMASNLRKNQGEHIKIIRTMPNTPSQIGKGVIGMIANSPVNEKENQDIVTLLQSNGACHWLEHEDEINMVTALSGSGPAYIFFMLEVMGKAAIKLGMEEKMAYDMAIQTLLGAGLLAETSMLSYQELRKNIASKGGTTEAALAQLTDDNQGLGSLMDKAIHAAYQRAKELSCS